MGEANPSDRAGRQARGGLAERARDLSEGAARVGRSSLYEAANAARRPAGRVDRKGARAAPRVAAEAQYAEGVRAMPRISRQRSAPSRPACARSGPRQGQRTAARGEGRAGEARASSRSSRQRHAGPGRGRAPAAIAPTWPRRSTCLAPCFARPALQVERALALEAGLLVAGVDLEHAVPLGDREVEILPLEGCGGLAVELAQERGARARRGAWPPRRSPGSAARRRYTRYRRLRGSGAFSAGRPSQRVGGVVARLRLRGRGRRRRGRRVGGGVERAARPRRPAAARDPEPGSPGPPRAATDWRCRCTWPGCRSGSDRRGTAARASTACRPSAPCSGRTPDRAPSGRRRGSGPISFRARSFAGSSCWARSSVARAVCSSPFCSWSTASSASFCACGWRRRRRPRAAAARPKGRVSGAAAAAAPGGGAVMPAAAARGRRGRAAAHAADGTRRQGAQEGGDAKRAVGRALPDRCSGHGGGRRAAVLPANRAPSAKRD